MSNLSKGRTSFDSTSSGEIIEFINKNAVSYPTDVGAPKFDLVPVKEQKDVMLNVARLHAKQEYDRIMDLVAVLQKQAEQLKRRLEITDLVHSAEYNFQIAHNQIYWLVQNKNRTLLTMMGPTDWATGKPASYEYVGKVKWLGDYTWIEVDDLGNAVL